MRKIDILTLCIILFLLLAIAWAVCGCKKKPKGVKFINCTFTYEPNDFIKIEDEDSLTIENCTFVTEEETE